MIGPATPATVLSVLCLAAAAMAGCAAPTQVVPGGGPAGEDLVARPYMLFTVIVPRQDGALEPAKAEADLRCGEVLQSAVMYAASDVGTDRRQFFFRCE